MTTDVPIEAGPAGPVAVRAGSGRIRLRDLFDETLAGIFARPARAMLTTLGTVLGLASLVATLGISRTAGNQIIERFDELQATQVTVRSRSDGEQQERQGGGTALPWDVESRLLGLNGVVAAGAVADVPNPGDVRTVPLVDPEGRSELHRARARRLAGVRRRGARPRLQRAGVRRRARRSAATGSSSSAPTSPPSSASSMSPGSPGLFVGEELFTVIGIVDAAPRDRGVLGSVMITSRVADERFDVTRPERVVIETELGAAGADRRAGRRRPSTRTPRRRSAATAPAPPTRARDDVQSDVNGLFLLLGVISLVVGAIGIANVTLVTVMERTGEIGLRRALGARRRHIAGQFLCESAAMGLVGGIVGASLGIIVVVGVSAARDWTPLLDPWLPFAAPPAGALVGLVAGLYPSIRAARMEPVEALRSGL